MKIHLRDVAQLGSALRSGRRGRWFESSHPDLLHDLCFNSFPLKAIKVSGRVRRSPLGLLGEEVNFRLK
ncbi:MAG: hypothetical protein RLZZ435_3659 [Cyanobacteriota bacterium]